MTVVDVLRNARKLVAAGWAGPEDWAGHCQVRVGEDPHSGAPVHEPTWAGEKDPRPIAQYSVGGAFSGAAKGQPDRDELMLAAWSAFERIVSPVWWEEEQFDMGHGFELPPLTDETRPVWLRSLELTRTPHGPTARGWLEDSSRTSSDVLRAFDKAINKAKTGERR